MAQKRPEKAKKKRKLVQTLIEHQIINLVQYTDLTSAKMPNGRSGGFIIEKADLTELLKAIPGANLVGKIVVHSSGFRPVNAVETARFVDECPYDRVAVEEQDHKAYVIHLSNEPEIIWLVVGSETPIFLELRDRHQTWAREHPGWNGWSAF